MNESIKGISLHYYKYSETSIIAKIFTKKTGLQNYVIKGIRNKNSKNKINLLVPLNIIELEVTNNKKYDMQYVKEIRNTSSLKISQNNMRKKFISMFIAEILTRVLVYKKEERAIYRFIENVCFDLNSPNDLNQNYSIIFLLKLSEYLGFFPNKLSSEKKYFDLENACFTNSKKNYVIKGEDKSYLSSILKNELINIPKKNRRNLISNIQEYYSLHHYNIKNLNSYEVIESLN